MVKKFEIWHLCFRGSLHFGTPKFCFFVIFSHPFMCLAWVVKKFEVCGPVWGWLPCFGTPKFCQFLHICQTWKLHVYSTGFLNQWAIGDFEVGHRAIRKIGCWVQKSLISVISTGELTNIEDTDALTFFRIKAKIARPEVKIFFFRNSGQSLGK